MSSTSLMNLPFGIEEEFALLDPRSYELVDRIDDMMDRICPPDRGEIKPDVHACIIECSTGICHSSGEALHDLVTLRRSIYEAAESLGLVLATMGLHPNDDWRKHVINPNPRYQRLLAGGALAPDSVVYGLHVHVEVPEESQRINAANELRSVIPLLIALSTSSPIQQGEVDQASYRLNTYAHCHTVGLPPRLGSFADVDEYISRNSNLGISVEKDLYWDVRPRRQLPTVEVRCMDSQNSVKRSLGLGLIVRGLVWRSRKGMKPVMREIDEEHLAENRRRAIKLGLEAELATNGDMLPIQDILKSINQALMETPWGEDPMVRMVMTDAYNGINEGIRLKKTYVETGGSVDAVMSILVEEFKEQLYDPNLQASITGYCS